MVVLTSSLCDRLVFTVGLFPYNEDKTVLGYWSRFVLLWMVFSLYVLNISLRDFSDYDNF